jgi:hypothetical protein
LQLQANYLKYLNHGQHPIDVARRISCNPWVSPRDRLAAAKVILEYSMRKIPTQMEVSGPGGQAIAIDNAALKNLSDAELVQLTNLLDKANTAKG